MKLLKFEGQNTTGPMTVLFRLSEIVRNGVCQHIDKQRCDLETTYGNRTSRGEK